MRPDKIAYAKKLRKRMTHAEVVLWEALRGRQLHGLKFRRQVPVGPFIVDFLCMARSVVVEVDGSIHAEQQEYDAYRDVELRKRGYRILRIANDQVISALPDVLRAIEAQCHPVPAPPSPGRHMAGREKGRG